MAIKTSGTIGAAVSLVIHIAVAVSLFAAITGAAIILNLVTKYCDARDLTAPWVIQGMHALEVVLWAADVICFLLLILVEVWKFCVTVWKDGKA